MDPNTLEQLVAEMGLGELDLSQREQLMASIGDLLETRLSEILANRMDDAQFAEFEKLAAGGDATATMNYLHMVVPDYDQLLRAEMDKIKLEFSAEAAELGQSLNTYKQATAELAQIDEQAALQEAQAASEQGQMPPVLPPTPPVHPEPPEPRTPLVPDPSTPPIVTPDFAPASQPAPTTPNQTPQATGSNYQNAIPPNDFV